MWKSTSHFIIWFVAFKSCRWKPNVDLPPVRLQESIPRVYESSGLCRFAATRLHCYVAALLRYMFVPLVCVRELHHSTTRWTSLFVCALRRRGVSLGRNAAGLLSQCIDLGRGIVGNPKMQLEHLIIKSLCVHRIFISIFDAIVWNRKLMPNEFIIINNKYIIYYKWYIFLLKLYQLRRYWRSINMQLRMTKLQFLNNYLTD